MTAIGPAVGQSVERADGRLKLSGQAEYTGDLRLPGMLYGAVLHSPVAHARIRSIDTSAAQQADGVVVVLTGDDLSGIDPYYGHALRDRPVVALGKVRFLGEPVAVVAAESQAAADAAVTLIDVEYDELPIAASLETALAPDAPLVHEKRPGRAARTVLATCPTPTATPATATRSGAAIPAAPSKTPPWWSRGSTPSRPSTSTRWRPTPRSRTGTAAN